MSKILLVEDEKILRDAFSILLRANNYTIDEAANGEEALKLFRSNAYDLILLDIMMPVLDGIGFLRQADVKTIAPHTKVVVLSNLSYTEMPPELKQLGVHRQEIKATLSTRDMIALVQHELTPV
jgi:CheY-like chemotaxis protein